MAVVGTLARSPVNGFRLPVSGGASAPLVAPGYLPTITSAPYAAYGAQRVVSGYSGPLFQLRRASDGATMDVSPQTGGDYPDYAAITTWIGASSATVAMIYDQSGNARHLTQATAANQPSFDPSQKFGNVVPILIDGYGRTSASGLPQPQVAKTPSVGGLTLNSQSMSLFMGVAPKTSLNIQAFAELSDDGVTTNYLNYFTGSGTPYTSGAMQFLRVLAATHSVLKTMPSVVSVGGFVTSPTGAKLYLRGVETADTTAISSQVIPRLTLGNSISGGVAVNGMYRMFAMVVYSATLSSADAATVQASINTALSVPASYDYAVTFDGDSIMEGSGGLMLRNMPSWLAESFTRQVMYFNTGIHGQKLADIYTNRASRFPATFQAGLTNVIFVEAGTNDLGGGTTGANLYANSTAPLVSYLKGLGFKVVICTILPRTGSSGWTAAMETERGNYNALVTANSAGADYVLDLTQNPTMGDASGNVSSTTYYTDKLHPTALGYRYLAGAPSGTYASQYTYYYALQQVLGATP